MSCEIEYAFTPRNFTQATICRGGRDLLQVQASSAMELRGRPVDCLREGDGEPMPGASRLWLKCRDIDTINQSAVELDREQVAALAGILLRWLATGFVQGEAS